jgi:methylenetetrahydrofolate reductase (NADPH)
LRNALKGGRFVVTFEISPPRGASLAGFRRRARLVRDWVDAVNVTDGQGAQLRVPSWAGCIALLDEDVEPVMQLQCRDRNRIALQSDLLGAAAIGVPNVNLMTGDPADAGDEIEARAVFDLDAIGLIRAARQMRDDRITLSGRPLRSPPAWLIGCVEDALLSNQEPDVGRFASKVEAGAEFVQTQYVYDLGAFENWMCRVRDQGLDERCFILPTVGPITSFEHLERLRKLPGFLFPEHLERRLHGVPAERTAEEGVAICAETIAALTEIPGVAGIHVIAADQEDRLPDMLAGAGIPDRKGRAATGSSRVANGGRS